MSTLMHERKSVESEVFDLENRYWRAIRDRDFDTCLEMTDDPCLVAGARGVGRIDHATFRKMMTSAEHSLRDFEISKREFRSLGDDVALLAYEIHEELNVDGKRVPVDASDTSVWQRKDGRWVCVLHTESLKGDPFGRDRRAAEKATSASS